MDVNEEILQFVICQRNELQNLYEKVRPFSNADQLHSLNNYFKDLTEVINKQPWKGEKPCFVKNQEDDSRVGTAVPVDLLEQILKCWSQSMPRTNIAQKVNSLL